MVGDARIIEQVGIIQNHPIFCETYLWYFGRACGSSHRDLTEQVEESTIPCWRPPMGCRRDKKTRKNIV